MTVTAFSEETASESPAPGGGSVAAAVGALGAALGAMVANLSSHKRGWDDRWQEFSDWAEKGQRAREELLRLVDEDTRAFSRVLDAFGLPKTTPEEKAARSAAIQDATKYATEIPFRVMETAFGSMEVMRAMTEIGLESSVSDAGVGGLCARTAVMGAWLNVRINGAQLKDRAFVDDLLARGADIAERAQRMETEILEIVEGRI